MKVRRKRVAQYVLGSFITCLMVIPSVHGQAAGPNAQQKPLMAEDVFKNVQILRGIPVKEFMGTINPSAGDLGMMVPLEHSMLARGTSDRERTHVFANYSLIGALAAAVGSLASSLCELASSQARSSRDNSRAER